MRKKMLILALIGFMATSLFAQTTQDHPRRIIGYFTEWRPNDYTVHDIPWSKITHINYAFAQVNELTNEVDFCDRVNAIEKVFEGQDPTLPYKGHFNLLTTYKKQYPDVKTLISIGGWAASRGFYTMCETPAGRETFANSAVKFMLDYGFDGLDIDYEYPTSTSTAGNPDDQDVAQSRRAHLMADYIEMLKLVREKLDAQGALDNKHYLLTIAAPASSWILGGMELAQYADYLDFINMMTYDFHGAWNEYVGHNGALLPNPDDNETKVLGTPVLNADWAYRYFRGKVPASKINMGVPYYSRGFKNVQGGTNGLWGTAKKLDGGGDGADGINNIWHDLDKSGMELAGGGNPIWHLKNLLRNTKTFSYQNHPIWGGFDTNYAGTYARHWDPVSKVPWIWNDAQKVFLSHEDEESITARANYIIDHGLGGMMIWELAGDFQVKPDGEYVMGDTLTTLAYDIFKANGTPAQEEMYPGLALPAETLDFSFEITGKYDHPNYNYKFIFTNRTQETIAKGWTIQFNMPTTTTFPAKPWGATTFTEIARTHDYVRYEMLVDGWGSDILPGASHVIEGSSKLCFAGGPNAAVLIKAGETKGWLSSDYIQTPDTEAPTVPTNVVASNISYDSVTLNWTASTDNRGVASYNVVATPATGAAVTANSSFNSISLTGLAETTSYSVTVQAVDYSGNVSTLSLPVDVVTIAAPVDMENPSTPGNLVANNIKDTTADLSWAAATDDIGVVGYEVIVNGGQPVTVNGLSHSLTGLAMNTLYTVSVKAFDAVGKKSLIAAEVSFTTLDVPPCTHEAWVKGQVYNAGEIVIHNNKHWICGWYTTAEPGTTGQWGAWQEYHDCGIVTPDQAPTVSLASSAASVQINTVVTLTADAADDKGVASVEFFNGTTSLGVVTAAPYTATFSSAVAGDYTFTAVATDTANQSTTSAAVTVTVTSQPVDNPPVVAISTPAVEYNVNDVVTITADASDDKGVASVEFFAGTTSLGVVTAAPYTMNYTYTAPVTITAVAKDTANQTTVSNAIDLKTAGTGPVIDPWAPNVLYKVNDTVSYGGSNWICVREHTSNEAWYPGAPGLWFWEKI